jgi:hypothetical protein
MREASFLSEAPVVVRFAGYRRSGTVRAYCGTTARAADSGFPALHGWAGRRRAGVGFPTVKCEVDSDRPGYWSTFGWIQWVTQEFPSGRKAVGLVDRPPAFRDRDIPFLTIGYAPTFFDAPAYLSLPAIDWRATLFLCTLPMMSRREAIGPLAGFTWGYRIPEQGERPAPHPLRQATGSDWRSVRTQLQRRHPKWRFASGYRPPKAAVR